MIETTHSTGERSLYVAWQDQVSRKYFPIGLLTFATTSPLYRFCYLKGAVDAKAHGFQPLAEFPDMGQAYYSNILFSVFANRLMPMSRPDYQRYVQRLGLAPGASEYEILTRSGGRRSTDPLELYPRPVRNAEGCFETFFMLHGIRYTPPESQTRIIKLIPGENLLAMWDMQNQADHTALALRTLDRYIIGYVPRYLLDDSWGLVNNCSWMDVTVSQVNPPPAPIQQRLLCRLLACWPTDYRPCASEEYEPICANTLFNISYYH